jgi:hypothetical protein
VVRRNQRGSSRVPRPTGDTPTAAPPALLGNRAGVGELRHLHSCVGFAPHRGGARREAAGAHTRADGGELTPGEPFADLLDGYGIAMLERAC